MALTQSARLPGPTWDEEVVPALRKRLESESRTLARRISSLEDNDWSESGHASHSEYPQNPPVHAERVNSRARTYSQPQKPNGFPSSSRQPDSKPTRIPKATRSRTGSKATPPSNGYSTTADLYPHNLDVNTPGLLHEQPPFPPGSAASSYQNSFDSLNDPPPRPSNDSEEHPYEHWYRGEVSRNGGVGELRVGKRTEMLDIANYGHPLNSRDSPAVRNAITEAIDRHRGRRKRADSIAGHGARERESFYMDEERAEQIAWVLDEAPLTDFEGEGSDSGNVSDYNDRYSQATYTEAMDISTSSEPLPSARSQTPTNIPRPSSRQQKTPTPTMMSRGMSEPPPASTSSASSSTPGRTQPRSASTSSTPQKRGPSPTSSRGTPSSAAKKSRMAASKATRAKLQAAREQDENRKSVAYYPTPEDGEMESAIPQWTQPVPVDGNWDNVVLPVVARKQGLNNGYETTDGSPKPKPPGPVAPAPGTFGYDHSKYRPHHGDEFNQLDEFGRPHPIPEESSSEPPSMPASTPYDEIRVGPESTRGNGASSPSPFSHYAPNVISSGNAGGESKLQPISGNATKLEVDPKAAEEEKEEGSGCCKCVVM